MTFIVLVLLILIVLLLGAVPTWHFNRHWNYWPGGLIGAILLVVLILLLFDRI